jgi:primosomal protein N' (replication factor Y)
MLPETPPDTRKFKSDMTSRPKIASVAVSIPLRKTFDYRVPEEFAAEQLILGQRVEVEFGNQRKLGVIVDLSEPAESNSLKLKPLLQVFDKNASLPSELLHTCFWAADYYQHPIGEVIHTALPPKLRECEKEPQRLSWQHSSEGLGLPSDALKRSKKQQEIHQYLLEHGELQRSQLKDLSMSASALKSLAEKGLITQKPLLSTKTDHAQLLKQTPLQLNHDQSNALGKVAFHRFQTYLLDGSTGSGKTEVYLQLAARALEQGSQVLVLIPEIGLTAQTISRFKARFEVDIAELHSNVSDGERSLSWINAREGKAKIIIGTRLAALAPIQNPGLIIVDEEHDQSYKQQDGLRYNARDLSVWRAMKAEIPIVLGSATPSLESLKNAFDKRYLHLRLPKRAGVSAAPDIEILDMRNKTLQAGLCQETLEELETTLNDGHQALVFLNRRGFAPILICHSCGWNSQCSRCSAGMTVHRNPPTLHCHQCDKKHTTPKTCPHCNNPQLDARGLGTEQIETLLESKFKGHPILRIDRDSTRNASQLFSSLTQAQSGEPCLLIGTQMLAKGHHLPNLKLVVVTDADQGLLNADFRAAERMGQLLVQVSGRAGREQVRGKVLIQSHLPDHPYLRTITEEGYAQLAKNLLAERHQASLPPYAHSACFRAESKRLENVLELLQSLKIGARKELTLVNTRIVGPVPCAVEKIKERFRYQLDIYCKSRRDLKTLVKTMILFLEESALGKRVRWVIDIDPIT